MSRNAIVLDIFVNAAKGVQQASAAAVKVGSDMTKAIAGPMNAAVNTVAVASIAAIAVGLTAGTKAAMEFEDRFAMVKKTMSDIDDPEVFDKIAKDLQDLAQIIPVRSTELADLAAVAGQLGVGADDISSFTEVIGKLSVATNMTGTQAATSLARFLNVTNESTDQAGKFASVMVELGNNVAAQESEIILLAQNFGATGTVAGLAAEDILAFSAATRESGVQAAAGATALGKMFMNISNAVKEGDVTKLATLSNLVGTDFATAFKEDGALAVQEFLRSLSELAQSGASVTPILAELGLNNVRTSRAVLSLANNNEGLAEAIELARKEADAQSALNEESAERFDTLAQQVELMKSSFQVFLQEAGEPFLDFFKDLVKAITTVIVGLTSVTEGVKELHSFLQAAIVGVLGGTTAFAFTNMAKAATTAAGGTGALATGLGMVRTAAIALSRMLGPVSIALGLLFFIGKKAKQNKETEAAIEGITNRVEELEATGERVADVFNENVMEGIIEGLPAAMAEGINKALEKEVLTEEAMEQSIEVARKLSGTVVELMRDATDGKGMSPLVDFTSIVKELEASGMTEEYSTLLDLSNDYILAVAQGGEEAEKVKELIIASVEAQLLMVEATRNARDMEAELVNILERHVGLEMAQEGFFKFMMANEEDRLSFAMRYKDTNKEIKDQLEDMGKIDPVEQYNDSMDQLVAKADSLNLMVEQMFKPIELQFEAQFSQMDLNDARQELADLNQEEVDLMADNIAINEEILELKEKELLTDEEILEQQELLNEALKIEQRIEEGKFLTDNQSLRKEKLKKDLRRVELAAAQGSLEFADKEIGAIKENIALIDAKAVSAEDAEKLRDKAEEIAQNAQVRRQEEIIELEERRIENNERLTEIPDDIVRANFKVLESQKDLILANTELFTSFEELGNVSETQAKRMAAALGIPYNIVKEMESLFTTGATAADYINKFLPEGFQTNFVPNIPPTRKSLKINSAQDFMNSPYAERGHGSFSSGGAVTNNNHLEVTATTIPSSDLAQRKFVKEISREMEKLGLGGFR